VVEVLYTGRGGGAKGGGVWFFKADRILKSVVDPVGFEGMRGFGKAILVGQDSLDQIPNSGIK
jgi:hypothetical protein